MKKLRVFFLPLVGAALLLAADQPKIPPMPAAVSGNAVVTLRGGLDVYSIMGVGPKKAWDDITNKVYVLNLKTGKWADERPVPGVAGRLGASAIGAKGKIFVFGGYVVDGKGEELTVGDVNAYLPSDKRWYRGADMPTPVDNAVIGIDHDRYIYIVGGRSKNGPVNLVQVYDVQENTWKDATPFPGAPVYGHAGGLIDGMIIFVDGAKKNSGEGAPYVASDECWMGKIERKDATKIEWTKLPAHPGSGRFAMVAGPIDGHKIMFSGGTITPHNYKGLDAEGKPGKVSEVTFIFDGHGNRWDSITEDQFDVRSDSRGLAETPIGPLIVGGMLSNTAVTSRVLMVAKK
jgi:N-acetylneuraminic acid mutarotase